MAMTGSQTGSMASGAASGAVAGSYFGPYGIVIGAVVGGALGYFSGDDGSSARLNSIYSEYNAIQMNRAGQINAAAIRGAAAANASMIMGAAGFNIENQFRLDSYNANLKSFLGDYNASLLEDEAALNWEASELELEQMENVFAREFGQLQVGYGASGVMMNQDTPQQVQIDAQTQHEMDVMIVRHGADIRSKKLLDSAARSRWEGNMAASSIMFEGLMNAAGTAGNALLNAAGVQTQGGINANMMAFNASVGANQTSMAGIFQHESWKSQDRQALASGLFQAGTAAGTAYSKTPSVNKTTTTSGAPYRNAPAYGTSSNYTSSLLSS